MATKKKNTLPLHLATLPVKQKSDEDMFKEAIPTIATCNIDSDKPAFLKLPHTYNRPLSDRSSTSGSGAHHSAIHIHDATKLPPNPSISSAHGTAVSFDASARCIRKNVSFGHVQVREYERILGDSPSCKDGLPLSIGWRYDTDREHITSVNNYEFLRFSRLDDVSSGSFIPSQDPGAWPGCIALSFDERMEILLSLGYSHECLSFVVPWKKNIQMAVRLEKVKEGISKAMKSFCWSFRRRCPNRRMSNCSSVSPDVDCEIDK